MIPEAIRFVLLYHFPLPFLTAKLERARARCSEIIMSLGIVLMPFSIALFLLHRPHLYSW